MSSYQHAIESKPARFMVLFNRDLNGNEEFQWSVQGQIPIMQLIGCVCDLQHHLAAETWMPECDNECPALAALWHPETREFSAYIHPEIPRCPLVGMLEIIKQMLVASKMGQQMAAAMSPLLGPDGAPMKRG